MNNTNIYTKLQQIQSKLNHLTKTEENKFQHYKYVSEYQILTILKPLLAENKLILLLSDTKDSFSKEKQEKNWIVQYQKQAILINSENQKEHLIFHFWACGENTDLAKAKGSAETYAVKYFLQKLFLIPTSDNLDPDKLDTNPKEILAKRELTEQEKEQVNHFLNKHNFSHGKN